MSVIRNKKSIIPFIKRRLNEKRVELNGTTVREFAGFETKIDQADSNLP